MATTRFVAAVLCAAGIALATPAAAQTCDAGRVDPLDGLLQAFGEKGGVRTALCRQYPPQLDGHELNTKKILTSDDHLLFFFRGYRDAESPKTARYADYVWDGADYGEDPQRVIAAAEREWRGSIAGSGRIPVFMFDGHAYDFDEPIATTSGSPTMGASHSVGPSKRLWKPDELERLVRLAVRITPSGKRPRILFMGCGMAFPPNLEFMKWLSKRPGRPVVIASEAPCHTTFWGWPRMTNVLIFSDGKAHRLGECGVPWDLKEW